MIKNSGVTNICIVVTRYFGGTLLGTGGLVRAYTVGAQIALDAAQIIEYINASKFSISINYNLIGGVNKIIEKYKAQVENTRYTDNVDMVVNVPIADIEAFMREIETISSGAVSIMKLEDNVLMPQSL